MDPLSAMASIAALIEVSYRVVDYLSDLKDGGRERMRLLAEVTSFCCTLDNFKELLDNDLPMIEEKWLQGIRPAIDQSKAVVEGLSKKLAQKDGKAERLFQSLSWSFTKDDVSRAVEQLHRLQATINTTLSQLNLSLSRQTCVDGSTSRQILEDQLGEDIRKWLSPLNFVAQQEATFANHCPRTWAQFLQSEMFNTWKMSARSTVWCRGGPGAGKTYLSSIVVEELQQSAKSGSDIVLVVYCRYDDPDCQNFANIVGELLKQCTRSRQMPKALIDLYRKHLLTSTRPAYEVLLTILSHELLSFPKAYIILDALDEIVVPDTRRLMMESLQSIQTNVSFMVMSRDIEDIKTLVGLTNFFCDCCKGGGCSHCGECPKHVEHLYHCGECDLPTDDPLLIGSFDACQSCYDSGVRCPGKGHTEMQRMRNCVTCRVEISNEDLQSYLQWRMMSEPSLKSLVAKKDGLQDQVLGAVLSSAGSMFLMAKLTIDALANCLTVKELMSSLSKSTGDLNVAYDKTIERITSQGQIRASRAFEVMTWVLLAKRPLTSASIEHAVSIEHGSDDMDLDDIVPAPTLASLCAGLVVIDRRGNFRFAHQTVPEYLRKSHANKFHNAEAHIAERCLIYLKYRSFTQGPCLEHGMLQARFARYPLYLYAARNWYKHLANSINPALGAALQFLRSEPHWRSARQTMITGPDDPWIPVQNGTVLHYAASLDAYHLFGDLRDMVGLNDRNESGRTPLMVAALWGSLGFAKELIKAGADPNIRSLRGETALDFAVRKEDTGMIDLLLTRRFEIF